MLTAIAARTGVNRWIEWRSYPAGKLIYAAARDITERKLAEEALRESETKFRQIVEASPMGMHLYQLDEQDRLIFIGANPAADRILGVDNAQFIGKTIEEAFPLLIQTEVPMRYRQAAREGITWKTDQINYEHGKICGAFEVYAFQTGSDRMTAMFLDITDRKQAEEEVHRLNEELEQRVHERTAELEAANKELQSFAYIVSHDLKAPLRAIAKLSQWLLEDYSSTFDAQGQEMVNLLVRRVKRMDNLIDGVLEYSRIGRVASQFESIDLNQLLPEVIDSLTPPPNIRIAITPKLPVIVGDTTRIQQIFANLIGNAMKFMDKAQGIITIRCEDADADWRFSVADNGPGIDPKYHDRIFQIFQTLQSRDEFESTGVGLSIVKKIVEFYGGKIWVESKVGNGSTFYFTLPKT